MQSVGVQTETEVKGARAVLAKLGVVMAALIAMIIGLEGLARQLIPATGLLQRSVDIQSAGALYAKIADFHARPGKKVVIMGDSLIYGQTMGEHGDRRWQDATLSRQLVGRLRQALPGRPVEILDLGMNGALPMDLLELTRLVTELKPDLLIFDLTLRSFSRDFGTPEAQRTRPWLQDLALDSVATLRIASAGVSDGWFRSAALNHSILYRLRDFSQSLLFGGRPADYVLGLRNAIDQKWRGNTQGGRDEDEILLLLRARARYANIDLAVDNVQRQALDQIVARLVAARQPTLAFYATENSEIRSELIEPERFTALQAGLKAALKIDETPLITYVGPLDSLPARHFLDHVHLDRHGYKLLAEALTDPALRLLGASSTSP